MNGRQFPGYPVNWFESVVGSGSMAASLFGRQVLLRRGGLFAAVVMTLWLPVVAADEPVGAEQDEPPTQVQSGEQQRFIATEAERVASIERVLSSYVMIGGGSGVVIAEDGLMLTNHHVIDSFYRRTAKKKKPTDRTIRVRVGDVFRDAYILGTDPRGDITLLQIIGQDDEVFSAISLADSDALHVGQEVFAIGNPFSTMQINGDPTVTTGVISLLHWFQHGYSDAIMTDAPINPGNSGGPLLTVDGQLAGINGQIRTKIGNRSNTGVGLAISANQIARFIPLLQKADGGVVLHGSLRGVRFDLSEKDGLRNGAEVQDVIPGSAADQAGLLSGDRIVSVAGLPVNDAQRFWGITQAYPENTQVTALVERQVATDDDGEQRWQSHSFNFLLEPIDPGNPGWELSRPRNGRELQQLQAKLIEDSNAMVPFPVTKVAKKGAAALAGLRKGDQIIALGGTPTPNLLAFNRALTALNEIGGFNAGMPITVQYRRTAKDGTVTEATVTLNLRSHVRRGK